MKALPKIDRTLYVTTGNVADFSKAVDAAEKGKVTEIVLAKDAIYSVKSSIVKNITGKTIIVEQNGAVIDYDAAATIKFHGTQEAPRAVLNKYALHDRTLATLSDNSGLKAGDM